MVNGICALHPLGSQQVSFDSTDDKTSPELPPSSAVTTTKFSFRAHSAMFSSIFGRKTGENDEVDECAMVGSQIDLDSINFGMVISFRRVGA